MWKEETPDRPWISAAREAAERAPRGGVHRAGVRGPEDEAGAIDVAAFLPLEEFTATIDETVDAIKSLAPADGTAEIHVPGSAAVASGPSAPRPASPLGPNGWRELTEVATALVPVPAPLG